MPAIDLERLRRHIGTEHWAIAKQFPTDPIRLADILEYTEATEDDNPLFRDRDFARRHGHADVIAPPGFTERFAPNYRAYHFSGGSEYLANMFPFEYPFEGQPRILLMEETIEPLRPVGPGDTVYGEVTVEDIETMEAGSAGRLVVTTFRKDYRLAESEPVGVTRWRVAAAESSFEVDPARGGRLRPAPIEDFSGPATEPPAAAGPSTGEVLPRLSRTVTMTILVKWSAVLWDMGIPHFDAEYVQNVYGLRTPLVNGPLMAAYHRAALTDWMGPSGSIERHSVRLMGPVIAGETVTVETRIEAVEELPDERLRVTVGSIMHKEADGAPALVSRGSGTCVLEPAG